MTARAGEGGGGHAALAGVARVRVSGSRIVYGAALVLAAILFGYILGAADAHRWGRVSSPV